jgi:hypothetical protein
MAALGDELVRHCWHLLHSGHPYRALLVAERALRIYQPPADSTLAGRLSLIVGVALAALGRNEPARRYLPNRCTAPARKLTRTGLTATLPGAAAARPLR